MTRDEEQFMKLGKEIIRMIHDVREASGSDVGYARRVFTFPGGEAQVIIANSKEVADAMERGAAAKYDIATAVPPSTKN